MFADTLFATQLVDNGTHLSAKMSDILLDHYAQRCDRNDVFTSEEECKTFFLSNPELVSKGAPVFVRDVSGETFSVKVWEGGETYLKYEDFITVGSIKSNVLTRYKKQNVFYTKSHTIPTSIRSTENNKFKVNTEKSILYFTPVMLQGELHVRCDLEAFLSFDATGHTVKDGSSEWYSTLMNLEFDLFNNNYGSWAVWEGINIQYTDTSVAPSRGVTVNLSKMDIMTNNTLVFLEARSQVIKGGLMLKGTITVPNVDFGYGILFV